ncbi:MAG: hypothetical protein NVSMB64_02940 [Candidatus Velthaea sp.]
MIVAGLLLTFAAGCAGGTAGSARSSLPLPSPLPSAAAPAPTPPPTTGRQYLTRFVVSLSGQRSLQVYPLTGAPVAPPGGTVGGVVAGAVVSYPDGTTQIADATGSFAPFRSTYAQARQKLLQTSPQSQPVVIVSDPKGTAKPVAAHVSAYASGSTVSVRAVRTIRSLRRQPRAAGVSINIAGIATLPSVQSVNSGDQVIFDLEGSDDQGNVVALEGARIAWSAQLGVITPIAGTNEAVYFAPVFAAGAQVDTIDANVAIPGTSVSFDSTSAVTAIGSATATTVGGIARTGDGSPIAGGVTLLVQNNLPRGFGPDYWLGTTDATGAYTQVVPASTSFTPALGVPPAQSPSGAFDLFAALAGGNPAFTTGGAGAVFALDLMLPPAAAAYVDIPSADALPSAVGNVRDAWYATTTDLTAALFQPDSGVQPLLANPPGGMLPFPAQPQPVGSGAFAQYCYQWETIDGAASLVLVEATGANCSAPGNVALIVTPTAVNAFSFARYAQATPYAIAAPLDPVPPGAFVVAAGNWLQAPVQSGGQIVSDDVSAGYRLYDLAHQSLNAPLFDETLTTHYDRLGSGSKTMILADTIVAHDTGVAISAYTGARTEFAPCSAGSGAQCLALMGTLTRTYTSDAGPFSRAFNIDVRQNGDGSGTLTYASATSGDLGRVVIPLASNAAATAANCRVCAGAPGLEYDIDGTTQVASFTITTAGLVQLNLLDLNRQPVSTLTFVL